MPSSAATRRRKRLANVRKEFVDPYRHTAEPYVSADCGGDVSGSAAQPADDAQFEWEDEDEWREPVGTDTYEAEPDSVVREIQVAMVLNAADDNVLISRTPDAVNLDGNAGNNVTVSDIENFFVGLQCKRDVPQKVLTDIIEYLRKNAVVVSRVLTAGELVGFRSMREHAMKNAPQVKVDVLCTDRHGEEVAFNKRDRFPRKVIGEKDLRLVYALYYVALDDIYAWHCKAHPTTVGSRIIDVSVDGVPESRSSGLSIDVLCVRFTDCRNLYCVAILQPWQKKLAGKDALILEPFLRDLPQSGLRVRRILADAPKRAPLQGLKSHAATSACPYCAAKKVNGKYPSSTAGEPLRSDGELRRKAAAAEDGVSNDDGVKGRGLAADIPGIDLIMDIPSEVMHLGFLGVVRKMLKLMYLPKPGQPRHDVRHMPADDGQFNAYLRDQKAFTNFSRCTRPFDRANYKSEEYRNLILCYWPIVMDTAPAGTVKAWLLTMYILRAVSLPDALYVPLKEKVKAALGQWYVEYERAFKAENCTYNTHVFHHIDLVRDLGPLWETSATASEDFYAILKKNYREGTTATGSQALMNTNLARMCGHHCERPRLVTQTATSRLEDRYVYTNDGRVMKITNLSKDEVRAYHVPVYPVAGLLTGVDLSEVLVFSVDCGRIEPVEYSLRPAEITGKVAVSRNYASVMLWKMFDI